MRAFFKTAFAVLAFFLLTAGCYAQQRTDSYYAAVDSAVADYSRRGYHPWGLAAFVRENFQGDTFRVRAFYTWIATNIGYDKTLLDQYRLTTKLISNFRPGGRSQDADTVLSHRKAVCEGFCNLMNRFCGEAGITSKMVPGITRVPGGEVQEEILHTWNAVKIHGKWQLVDITWAAGYVDQRNQYVRKFSGNFFLTPPEQFVQTHWPLDAMWQLLEMPVSKAEFYEAKKPDEKPHFRFRDSIEAYLRLAPVDREYADLLHYQRNDPDNPVYTEGCDHFIYNQAATKFNRAMLFFDDYLAYARTLKGKEISMKEVHRCLKLLEEPKRNLEEGLKFAQGKRFFHQDVRNEFERMVQKSAKLLVELNGYIREYRRMEAALK